MALCRSAQRTAYLPFPANKNIKATQASLQVAGSASNNARVFRLSAKGITDKFYWLDGNYDQAGAECGITLTAPAQDYTAPMVFEFGPATEHCQ